MSLDAAQSDRLSPVAAHFLAALSRSVHATAPYDHWLLEDVLPEQAIDDIVSLPVAPPEGAVFNGTREVNNSTRLFFSRASQKDYPVCAAVAEAFADPRVIRAIEAVTRAPVSKGRLRIEYCQDVTGFWLEPHVDISVKLFTMVVYLSDDPALHDAGTDIFDASPEHRLVGTAPYGKGRALIFIPGRDTWHGFKERPIAGVRKSIIVNYVSPDWRSVEELA
jgi:hypothetical protein